MEKHIREKILLRNLDPKIESPLQITHFGAFHPASIYQSAKMAMVHIVEDCDLMGPPRGIRAICEMTVASRL